jgi:NAD(P)H-dependent flavin oxidoreductase YrpB (nitropropane dioxygenase family)
MAWSVKHLLHHKAAGVDTVIQQDSEGGGKIGDGGSDVI